MRTIVLADNQDITRAGIRYICSQMTGSHPICEVPDRKALINVLSDCPDAVVVLDYTLFDLTGPDDLLILQARFQQVNWLLFSESLTEDFIRRVLFSSSMFCIVLKDALLDEIRSGLHAAVRNTGFVCARVNSLLEAHPEEKEKIALTSTERDILKLIALGKTTKEIAADRYSSVHTITTHRKNIFRKLEVNNVHEATKYALRAGIIDSAEYYI